MTATPRLTLTLMGIVKREEHAAPLGDERRRLIKVVASYRGTDGHEYRKGFEGYTDPRVPDRGTHSELNNLKEQWR